MRLLQIILLVLSALFLRRWFRSMMARRSDEAAPPRPDRKAHPPAGLEDLTQQDISDADYEEIP